MPPKIKKAKQSAVLPEDQPNNAGTPPAADPQTMAFLLHMVQQFNATHSSSSSSSSSTDASSKFQPFTLTSVQQNNDSHSGLSV
jgi:hypothetical protein